jgi:alanine dehydrogenase
MLIGVPKEIKDNEYRVGMVPPNICEVIHRGQKVIVQSGAGAEIGFDDAAYEKVGAEIVDTAEEVFARADMIVKVKEPQPVECNMLREDQVLFTYLHLAPDPYQTKALKDSGCVAIAYETVTDAQGRLPLLAPMSEVAGRMSVQAAAYYLEKTRGGRGVLIGGVSGVEGAKVVVIGAVLVPGAAAPKLVTREMVGTMKPGAVMVDVAIDQGGCFETSHATTHTDPVYVVDGITHYCVANMPGAVPRTSTIALNNATLPHILTLASKGYKQALDDDINLRNGLNVHKGESTYEGVAETLGYDYVDPVRALAA